jgi:HEAT repeat protein
MIQISVLILTALLVQSPSLDSASPKERLAAIEQMAKPGNTEAIAPLTAALKKETKSDVRAQILAGLVRIGGSGIPPVLAMSLSSDLDKNVRLQAIESIQRLYIPAQDSGTITTLFNQVKSVVTDPDRPALPAGVVADKVSTDALATAMQKDAIEEVRAASARLLGTLKAKDYVPAIVTALEDPQNRDHRMVRVEAIQSLGVIRDPASGPALEKSIKEVDFTIAKESIRSIGLMGYKPARPQIEEIFKTNPRRELKDQALESLALLRDPGGKPLFESLLTSTNDFQREKAVEGLARTDYDAQALSNRSKPRRNRMFATP